MADLFTRKGGREGGGENDKVKKGGGRVRPKRKREGKRKWKEI